MAVAATSSSAPAARQEPWTVRRMLEWCAGFFDRKAVDAPRLSAEMILAHVLGVPRIRLYTDLHRPLTEPELAATRDLVRRAADHEPIQYLTGRCSFYSMDFEVTPDVLIPRPDTETLVERALNHLKHEPVPEPRVLDLCTGSGCVAAAIARHHKSARVVATDVSLPALDVARRNVARHKLDDRVTCHVGDLYDALGSVVDPRPFHLIVGNPPYVASGQIAGLDRNVRDFEPRLALDGGADGLDVHRRIVAGAADRLEPGGRLMLEIAFDQEEPATYLLRQHAEAFDDARVHRDLAGRPRVVSARRR